MSASRRSDDATEPDRGVDRGVLAVLSTADWNRPLWTNKQHLTVELSRQLETIFYVESLGLRRPRINMNDLSRVLGRLRSSFLRDGPRSESHRPENVTLVHPLTVPYHRPGTMAASYNRLIVRQALRPWIKERRHPRWLWAFSPITYGLDQIADKCIYHSVDLLHEFPGIDSQAILSAERRLAARGVQAVASSPAVATHLQSIGFDHVRIWGNVAHSQDIARLSSGVLREEGGIIFAGNLSEAKVNVELLYKVASSLPRATLHIAGPIAEGGGTVDSFANLLSRRNVEYHGVLRQEQLATLMGRCTVGLIPYQINAYTIGVHPMKVFEYLAAGLAVVSTDLPALRHEDHVQIATTQEQFIQRVRASLGLPGPQVVGSRREFANAHSWEKRGTDALALLLE